MEKGSKCSEVMGLTETHTARNMWGPCLPPVLTASESSFLEIAESALWSHWQDCVSLDVRHNSRASSQVHKQPGQEKSWKDMPPKVSRRVQERSRMKFRSPTTDWSHITRSQGHLHFPYCPPMQLWDLILLSIFQPGQIFHVGNLPKSSSGASFNFAHWACSLASMGLDASPRFCDS